MARLPTREDLGRPPIQAAGLTVSPVNVDASSGVQNIAQSFLKVGADIKRKQDTAKNEDTKIKIFTAQRLRQQLREEETDARRKQAEHRARVREGRRDARQAASIKRQEDALNSTLSLASFDMELRRIDRDRSKVTEYDPDFAEGWKEQYDTALKSIRPTNLNTKAQALWDSKASRMLQVSAFSADDQDIDLRHTAQKAAVDGALEGLIDDGGFDNLGLVQEILGNATEVYTAEDRKELGAIAAERLVVNSVEDLPAETQLRVLGGEEVLGLEELQKSMALVSNKVKDKLLKNATTEAKQDRKDLFTAQHDELRLALREDDAEAGMIEEFKQANPEMSLRALDTLNKELARTEVRGLGELENMSPEEIYDAVESLVPGKRPGSLPHQQTVYDLAATRANDIQQRRVKDPATSVSSDVDVAAATAALDLEKPETYQNLMEARIAAQERLRIPAPAPITRGEAQTLLSPLRRVSDPRAASDALRGILAETERLYGDQADEVLKYSLATTTGIDRDVSKVALALLRKTSNNEELSVQDEVDAITVADTEASREPFFNLPFNEGAAAARIPFFVEQEEKFIVPPYKAIQFLIGNKSDPGIAKQFDEKYGAGSAARVLGE